MNIVNIKFFSPLKCMPFLCQPLHSTLPSISDNHLGCNFGGDHHPLPFKLSCDNPSLCVTFYLPNDFISHTCGDEISPPILHNNLVVKTYYATIIIV